MSDISPHMERLRELTKDPMLDPAFAVKVIEAMPDAIVLVDDGGRIVHFSTRAEWMFGYSREEMMHQPVEVLLPERFRDVHRSKHRPGYGDDPRLRPMGMGLDLFGVKKNGEEFPVEVNLSPVVGEGGVLTIAVLRRKHGGA